MTYIEIDRAKAKFLQEAEERLSAKVSRLQKTLFDLLALNLTEFLEVNSGILSNNNSNFSYSSVVDKVFKEFSESEHLKLVSSVLKDMSKISEFNSDYFGVFKEDPKRFTNLQTQAQSKMLKYLGATDKGLKRGGFLDSVIKDTSTRNRVSQLLNRAITGDRSLKETMIEMREMLTDTENEGLLQRHYRTYVYDTYQRYDRIESNIYAKELKMGAARYAGTRIDKTRKFCKDRINKVFTREEIEEWENLEFNGKKDNYDPFTDLGGWNCRHRLRWIPNEIAVKRRKDLKLDEKGNLIKK